MSYLIVILLVPVVGVLGVGTLFALVCIAEESYNGCMRIKSDVARWFA